MCMHMYTVRTAQSHMEIHVHSTLAFRKQKEKKGKVTRPTIAQTNMYMYLY